MIAGGVLPRSLCSSTSPTRVFYFPHFKAEARPRGTMGDGVPSWLRGRRGRSSMVEILSLSGRRLQSLSIWCFCCCCFFSGKLTSSTFVPHFNSDLVGSSSSSSSGISTGEIVKGGGELGISSLIQSATNLLLRNYRPKLEATIPSPEIDAHQVNMWCLSVQCRYRTHGRSPDRLSTQYTMVI